MYLAYALTVAYSPTCQLYGLPKFSLVQHCISLHYSKLWVMTIGNSTVVVLIAYYIDSDISRKMEVPSNHGGLSAGFDCACEPQQSMSHRTLAVLDVDWGGYWSQCLTTGHLATTIIQVNNNIHTLQENTRNRRKLITWDPQTRIAPNFHGQIFSWSNIFVIVVNYTKITKVFATKISLQHP